MSQRNSSKMANLLRLLILGLIFSTYFTVEPSKGQTVRLIEPLEGKTPYRIEETEIPRSKFTELVRLSLQIFRPGREPQLTLRHEKQITWQLTENDQLTILRTHIERIRKESPANLSQDDWRLLSERPGSEEFELSKATRRLSTLLRTFEELLIERSDARMRELAWKEIQWVSARMKRFPALLGFYVHVQHMLEKDHDWAALRQSVKRLLIQDLFRISQDLELLHVLDKQSSKRVVQIFFTALALDKNFTDAHEPYLNRVLKLLRRKHEKRQLDYPITKKAIQSIQTIEQNVDRVGLSELNSMHIGLIFMGSIIAHFSIQNPHSVIELLNALTTTGSGGYILYRLTENPLFRFLKSLDRGLSRARNTLPFSDKDREPILIRERPGSPSRCASLF